MDKLWAPWRMKYIEGHKASGSRKKAKCLFCRSLKNPHKNYVVLSGEHSFAMLNIYPYNNGHIMVSPIRHVRDLGQLRDKEILDLFRTLNKSKKLLDRLLKPHGYNIGINTSLAAGAGEASHLHIHIVPRFVGDSNFMPTLYNTKVIPQSLEALYKRLKKYARSERD